MQDLKIWDLNLNTLQEGTQVQEGIIWTLQEGLKVKDPLTKEKQAANLLVQRDFFFYRIKEMPSLLLLRMKNIIIIITIKSDS